jgi:hypothetical protein
MTITQFSLADQTVRGMDLGFRPLNVERPFGEPGVYIGDDLTALIAKMHPEHEKSARLLANAPRLLSLLLQAQGALPDATFAAKCGISRDLIEQIDAMVGMFMGRSPSFDANGTVLVQLYPEGQKYAQVFAHAEGIRSLLVRAQAALPGAWKAVKDDAPTELLEEIDALIALTASA